MNKIADFIKDNILTTHLIVDSTPLKDMPDPEAQWGFGSCGLVEGFKLHVAVNQLGLPLRVIVSPCNRFGFIFLPKLLWDLEVQWVLVDAGYHLLRNIDVVKAWVLCRF